MRKFSPRRVEIGPAGLVALAVLVWGAALLRPDRAPVWGTPALQFIPWRVWAWRVAQAGGGWPWWNPALGLGAPLIANLQMAWFYPPTWLLWALAAWGGVPALAWGHGLLLVLHLLWAAWGMLRLGRALGWRAPGPEVAALAYALSGYLTTRAEVFLSMNAATAWLPWVLLAGWHWVHRPGRRTTAALAATVSLQILAGHAQTAWYTLVLLATWLGLWAALRARRASGAPWRAWARGLLAAAALTLLLTAPQIVPTAEYLAHSARAAGVERTFALTYSLWPWRLLGLVAPNFFGSPVTGDYWGYGAYYEDALYVGLLPLALALSTWPWLWRASASRALTRWAWAVVVVSLLLALGRHTPVFPWLYDHVPTFAMFQAPTRWSLAAVFALALLAGMRAASWGPPGPRGRYALNLSLAAALGLAVLGAVATRLAVGRAVTMTRAVAWAGVWAWGAAALARWCPRLGTPRRILWTWAVVLWVAADLVVGHWGWTPTVPASFYAGPGPTDLPVGRVYFPFDDEYAFKFDDFFRMADLRPARPWSDLRAVGLPNVRLLDDAATWNNFDPLVPGRYARLRQALDDAPPGARERLLDRMAVVAEVVRDPAASHGRRVVPRQPEPYAQWFPQALVVPTAEEAWAQVWQRAGLGGPKWGRQVVVEAVPLDLALGDAPWAAAPASPADRGLGPVQVQRPAPDRVVVTVHTDRDGWLLLAEQAYPGWQAAVDGARVPVYRAEYALLAVPVPAGQHTVVWAYRPAWWPLVGWLGLLGVVGLAALGWGKGFVRPGPRGMGYDATPHTARNSAA